MHVFKIANATLLILNQGLLNTGVSEDNELVKPLNKEKIKIPDKLLNTYKYSSESK